MLAFGYDGGSILNQGTLQLTNVLVSQIRARDGAGIGSFERTVQASAFFSSLTLDNSTLPNNNPGRGQH